ncbi:MAG: LytTR family transcriptional regulator [Chitinophagales bacterium]|nr:LytTR family transcriptional regulator [Chitinophagales bacterium]
MQLVIDYDLLKGWKPIVVTTFLFELIFLSIVYLHPENMDWIRSKDFSMLNLIRFVFLDQILIECISVAIIFTLIRQYANRLKLFQVQLTIRDLIWYEIKFLPLLLISFFIFAPFTLTVRYLFHYWPNLSTQIYFEEYFYSPSLYMNYLFPVLIIGYSIINVNLIRLYNKQLSLTTKNLNKAQQENSSFKTRLKAFDESGELLLEVEGIKWIERKDRKTYAHTTNEEYRLKESISELAHKLNPDQFIQINRSTIINLQALLNYSFWENDKYIVRLKDSDKEFVMSRMRLKKIKEQLLS